MLLNKTSSEMVRYLVKKSYLKSIEGYLLIDNLCENGLSDLHTEVYISIARITVFINFSYKNYKYEVKFCSKQLQYDYQYDCYMLTSCNEPIKNTLIYKLCQTLYKDKQHQ